MWSVTDIVSTSMSKVTICADREANWSLLCNNYSECVCVCLCMRVRTHTHTQTHTHTHTQTHTQTHTHTHTHTHKHTHTNTRTHSLICRFNSFLYSFIYKFSIFRTRYNAGISQPSKIYKQLIHKHITHNTYHTCDIIRV